jgi:hypothetical protein
MFLPKKPLNFGKQEEIRVRQRIRLREEITILENVTNLQILKFSLRGLNTHL